MGLLLAALTVAGVDVPKLATAVVAAAFAAFVMRQWLRRRLGGYTGDGLGATEQLAEIAVLLAFTASF